MTQRTNEPPPGGDQGQGEAESVPQGSTDTPDEPPPDGDQGHGEAGSVHQGSADAYTPGTGHDPDIAHTELARMERAATIDEFEPGEHHRQVPHQDGDGSPEQRHLGVLALKDFEASGAGDGAGGGGDGSSDERTEDGIDAGDEVVDPADVDDEDTEEPPAAGALGLPWWAVVAVTIALLIIYAIVMIGAWDYIVTTDEKQERGDWDQLNAILDKIDYVVLFVLGSVLGVTVQNRQTQAARNAAKKNQKAAKKHRETAIKNRQAARKNKRTALNQGAVARRAANAMDGVRRDINELQRNPQVRFVKGPVMRGRLDTGSQAPVLNVLQDQMPDHVVIPERYLSTTAPELDDLAERLDAAATRCRDKAL